MTDNDRLQIVITDTFRCWKRTRVDGISASLAADGDISIPLLKVFDKVAKYGRMGAINE